MPDDLYSLWLKVAPGPRPPDHYALLGLPRFCETQEQIEAAAQRQLDELDRHSLHNDIPRRDACHRMMNEVARARVALTNPQKRAAYDLTLEPGRKAPTPAPSVPASPSVLPPVIEAVEREKPGPNLLQRIIAYATANPVLWIVPAACIGVIAIIIARATRPSPLPKTLAISVSPSTKSSPAIIPPRTMGIPAHPLVSVEPKPLPATTSTALVPGHESPLPATAPTIPVEIAKPKPPQPPTIVSTRKPLPSTDLREKSSKLVDQIYGDDIAAAKTQKAKADLARKMLAEVGALGDHDADRFV
ncbi:MAG TPA: hypothetical protein VFC46_12445, partial [Humisphaera sp.]|nr:hypothetical protein [Humisphaera sp.]